MTGSSSVPVMVEGKIDGAVFVVVTCTLHCFGQISFIVSREMVVILSYGGIKVATPVDDATISIAPVYVV